MRKAKVGNWRQSVAFVAMFVVALILLTPILWLISASFQGSGQIFQNPFNWIPTTWLWSNYTDTWSGDINLQLPALQDAFKSSLIVAAIAVPVHVALNTYIGYVLAKYRFGMKSLLLFMILCTMMIPQSVTLFPNYLTVKNLGLIDTQLGIALPSLISGFGTFLMMQFARGVPDEYLEAARIDGSSDLWTFLRIGVPLMKAAVATLTILMFTYMWNEYTWSHLVVNSEGTVTLPVTLVNVAENVSGMAANIPNMLAGCAMSFVPVLIVFLVFQRQFIESVSQSGIKG